MTVSSHHFCGVSGTDPEFPMYNIGVIECVHAKKHGHVKHKDLFKWREKSSIRTNCKFRVNIISDKSSPWLISRIVDKHNHPMFRGVEEHSRSAQKLDSDMLSTLKDFSYAGLRMTEARKMLQSKYPTRYFHGKTIRNIMNRVRADISNHLSNRAMELTQLLKELARNEDWFVATDISKIDGRLNRVFWMDPEQRCLYRRYHDVVLNNTTATDQALIRPIWSHETTSWG
ncbi:hypothetical protein B0O80DRAFT_430473 [Mortierella sp. GBAus27b]|nr:hypothetical protein B0O80DRAFT_430473 [Mortierella sp. GBAus27b]